MTTERLALAAADRDTYVAADGLLAAFNDADVLDVLDVSSAMAICRLLGEPDERVSLAAALAVRGTRFGHVCIRLDTIREAVVVDGQELDTIESLPWPDPDEWAEALVASPLVGDGGGDHPLVLDDGRLYLQRFHRYERVLAELIRRRCAAGQRELTPAMAAILRRLLAPAGDGEAASRQLQAAEAALTHGFAVIAGGPGTGKTHTVGAILAALATEDDFPGVALCAPTGKAAARLGEAVAAVASGLEDPVVRERVSAVVPSTIHRLLGWTWGRGRFVHDAAHRLPHDLVVVDEMSMVSLPMATKLLSAIRDDATVVLVGDPFQLESIEAGTVLTDIVSVEAGSAVGERIVVLDRVHRFDTRSTMADFAQAVRLGEADDAVSLLGQGDPSLRWVHDRTDDSFSELWERVVEQRSEAVRLSVAPSQPEEALAALGRLAVLCARRRGPDSVAKWGRDIEGALDQRFTGLRYGGDWYPGRPVMITSNDYRLDLFNGDIGVTVQAFDGLRVVFERGGSLKEYSLARLGEHATVHAMTIHKSQGSQFEEVVVVLPDEASRLLTRELLYTAVTRASRRVWLVGSEAVVRHAIGRSVERASGLNVALQR